MHLAKITIAIVAVATLTGFTALALNSGVGTDGINFSVPKLQSTEAKLQDVNIRYEKLNTQLDKKSSKDKKTIESLKQQKSELEQQREVLKQQLQAKADAKVKLDIAAANAANTLTGTGRASAASYAYVLPAGSHTDWMAQAGIDPANYGYVEYIVSQESGWDPCSYNPGRSNCNLTAAEIGYHACGLGQQLPCGKWAGAWNDPIAALVAMSGYVQSRYGGWAGAYSYWQAHHNY